LTINSKYRIVQINGCEDYEGKKANFLLPLPLLPEG
jgi:hypothetical protein